MSFFVAGPRQDIAKMEASQLGKSQARARLAGKHSRVQNVTLSDPSPMPRKSSVVPWSGLPREQLEANVFAQ